MHIRMYQRQQQLCLLFQGIALVATTASADLSPDFAKLFPKSRTAADTLVLYTYSATDPEYAANLNFFIRNGIRPDDGCHYIFVIQQVTQALASELPKLPSNARYVHHENACYDWGTFGWALFKFSSVLDAYKYFIFMNSSVRGPFLPAYWPGHIHWSRLFTSKLNDEVKLVGSTISCEAYHESGDIHKPLRQNPHVQSYIVSTDQVGLAVLIEDGNVFQCHKTVQDAVFHAELGSALAIFGAGHTIDSLMLRYQGVDWRNQNNWNCNAMLNPYADQAYDGTFLNPLEVLFVKVKSFQIEAAWESTRMAVTYEKWASQEDDKNANEYAVNPLRYKFGRIIQMNLRGAACFDWDLYYQKNGETLQLMETREQAWTHFVNNGQFSGEAFRFTCEDPLENDQIARSMIDYYVKQMDVGRQL